MNTFSGEVSLSPYRDRPRATRGVEIDGCFALVAGG